METEADCGGSTQGSLAFYDHDTSSWKTSQLSLEGESTEFAGTWPSSGIVRNGKLFSRPTLLCRTVENASALLPTPTKSFGVNARGWGLSQTGRRRFSKQVEENALQFGYRPPINLLEWMMGFPENFTQVEHQPSETQSSHQLLSGSESSSLSTLKEQGVKLTSTAAEFDKSLSYEEWEQVGFELFGIQQSWQWWVGDWINYGEKKYGETYKGAIAVTGRNYQTLVRIASVCGRFESQRRRLLSFKHHCEVQALPTNQQDELLDQAESEAWSCARLREEVRSLQGIESDDEPDEPELEDDDEYEDADDDSDDQVIQAFASSTERLSTLRKLIAQLEPHEIQLLKEWLQ